jgi:8-oxo-dGTP pyrophosphatase MutT (NUDIX family)
MQTKVLIIVVVKKGNAILMRKKPDGSPPYEETWYLFGGEVSVDKTPDEVIKETALAQTGIHIEVAQKFSWDTEVKYDLDGVEKYFVYLDVLCDYVDGELVPGPGIERLEWVEIGDLPKYDIVPPSRVLFQKLGYLSE